MRPPGQSRRRRSQPLVDGRDEDCSLVADHELVVARRHGVVPFEVIDAALDRMTLAAVGRGAAQRLAAAGAELPAVECFYDQG